MFELFELEICPDRQKVIKLVDDSSIQYKKHDITNPEQEETLIRLGGKRQVPFLYNKQNGLKMYESADIIEYLSNL